MSREAAESRQRLLEDQLAGLQEELRRVSELSPASDAIQTDLLSLQADLAEAAVLRQRQDETLRQRERELTALKGALKEEVECHDREMETLREQYSVDMENLRRTMEQVTQSQEEIEEQREQVNASVLTLEEELERSRVQGDEWKTRLESSARELSSTREQLEKTSVEKEGLEKEVQSLKESMKTQGPASDLSGLAQDLKRARADLEKQKGEMSEKTEALLTLRKSSSAKESELQDHIRKLKEQQKHRDEVDRVKESSVGVGKTAADSGSNAELQEANIRLRERLARLTRLHSTPRGAEVEEAVEALEDENRALRSQMEESKRATARLCKERDELNRRLEEREQERDVLRRGKTDLEEQKRLLDRALDKINKEMELMMGDSRQSVATLQSQLEEYRERSRKDLQEAQRSSKERLSELQRAQGNLKTQQEEVSRLKKELLTCSEERDGAQLERDLLNNRLKHLESELDSEKSSQTDRSREIRGLELKWSSRDRFKQWRMMRRWLMGQIVIVGDWKSLGTRRDSDPCHGCFWKGLIEVRVRDSSGIHKVASTSPTSLRRAVLRGSERLMSSPSLEALRWTIFSMQATGHLLLGSSCYIEALLEAEDKGKLGLILPSENKIKQLQGFLLRRPFS
uniref:Rootletin-like n=1 Tax=Knipowitschia caucasica TaxID=637954 RepID=A0AAV2K7M3_KNICA